MQSIHEMHLEKMKFELENKMPRFNCSKHQGLQLSYFDLIMGEFICHKCLYERQLKKNEVNQVKDSDLIEHADYLIKSLKNIKMKIDDNLSELHTIVDITNK